jgi:ubiquinone/menaquinone biosynthesis C-methylase UbiE
MYEKRRIKNRYDKIAGGYDVVDYFIPDAWRRKATSFAYGRVLEVGVGTGLNLPFYPESCQEVLGIDISGGMLTKAHQKVLTIQRPFKLELMDVLALPLDSHSFDCVLAAFVFCSVTDPLLGLRECRRVLKPGGRLILLEHVASDNRILGRLLNWLNPLTVMLLGDHVNRRTFALAVDAGFRIRAVENLLGDVVRLVVAEN